MKRLILLISLILTLTISSCSSKKAVSVKTKGNKTAYIINSTEKEQKKLISEARSWIGTPYAYGCAEKGRGTDCSGMIMSIFYGVYGIKLPRSSAMQQEFSRPVKYDKMQPGDLVFFTTSKNSSRVNHVGLYVGNGRMIHASSSCGVMESSLSEKYWQNNYHSSGAVIDPDNKTSKAASKPQPSQANQPQIKPMPPAQPVPSISARNLQLLYNALDHQIDSINVTNPEIFD